MFTQIDNECLMISVVSLSFHISTLKIKNESNGKNPDRIPWRTKLA